MSMPPSSRTTVRRKPQRARYARADIEAIVDGTLICHVAFADGAGIHSLPMACWRVGDDLYVHAASNSRIAAALLGGECCVSIALVDGLVLARAAFHHSMNFRSVVVYGQFVAVDDPETAKTVYEAFVNHVSPGRSAQVRGPSPAEISGTRLLRLPLAEAAAKVRAGGVEDSRDDMGWPVWAGVVPVALRGLPPLPDPGSAAYPQPVLPAMCVETTVE